MSRWIKRLRPFWLTPILLIPCLSAISTTLSACSPVTATSQAKPIECEPGFDFAFSIGCSAHRYPELIKKGKPASSRISSSKAVNRSSIPILPQCWQTNSSSWKYFKSIFSSFYSMNSLCLLQRPETAKP